MVELSSLPLPTTTLPAAARAAEAQARLARRTVPSTLEARARAAVDCPEDGVQTAYAECPLPLSAEHAHYVDGVGLYLRVPGAAVACCPAETLRVEVEGDEAGDEAAALRAVLEEAGLAWHVVGVVERPVGAMAAVAGLVAALVSMLPEAPPTERLAVVLSAAEGRPVSKALLAAARLDAAESPYVLADARTGRARSFPVPPAVQPGADIAWALVDVGVSATPTGDGHRARAQAADAVAVHLRAGGLGDGLASLRDLEHRSLADALAALPEAERPLTRYLVGEDRRAQRMVAALRRGRVPMLGATLLIGHDALAQDAGERTDEADWVVEQGKGEDGLFGARAFGGARFVLVLGRPYVLPAHLDRIKAGFAETFGRPLRVRIL